MGFNPRQPRGKDGEWTGRGSGTHLSGPHVSGSFKTHPKQGAAASQHRKAVEADRSSRTPSAPPKNSVTKRADALNAAGKNAKAQKVVKSALAQNSHQLEQNRAKQAEVKARLAENKAKIARSNYILKNGLAGASNATIDAHMRAHGKK